MYTITKFIGNTPIYQIENTNIYVKLEKFNPGGSSKDRAIVAMLEHALKENNINKEKILVEAVTENIGVSLALWSAIYQISVLLIVPDSAKSEKRKLMQFYGAKLILTEGSKGMKGAIEKMEEFIEQENSYFSLRLFDNKINTHIHYETTGKEIIKQIPNLDIFITCSETGGSFSGIAKRLKESQKKVMCILGEPENSAVVSGYKIYEHSMEGIGIDFLPSLLDKNYIDDIMLVSKEDAKKEILTFMKTTGIWIGLASGANLALAKRLARYYPHKKIVTLAPDGGDYTLSFLEEGKEIPTM